MTTTTAYQPLKSGDAVTFRGRPAVISGAGKVRTNELTGEQYQIVHVDIEQPWGTDRMMIGTRHSELVRP